MKTLGDDEIDVEGGKFEKDKEKMIRSARVVRMNNQALLSGIAYCMSSSSMILVNKYVLSSYGFNAGISLMLYQVNFRIDVFYIIFVIPVFHNDFIYLTSFFLNCRTLFRY